MLIGLWMEKPTAVQLPREGQDTLNSLTSMLLGGFGTA